MKKGTNMHTAVLTVSLLVLLLSPALGSILKSAPPERKPDARCTSTIFGYPGDKHAGGDALFLGRPVRGTDYGIAHRTWKGHTKVYVYNTRTKRGAVGKVLDRGPYGVITPEGDKVLAPFKYRRDPKNLPPWEGEWAHCADLTPALARKIGHDGLDRVKIWRLR